MTIWHFQRQLTSRLLRWAVFSVAAGGLMRRNPTKFWRGAGMQFVSWGIINAMIAAAGSVSTENRLAQLDNPGAPEILEKETRNLRRLLWINAGLDVVYVLAGRWWSRRDKGDGSARGHGFGIIIQGLFLLVFDVLHARLLHEEQS